MPRHRESRWHRGIGRLGNWFNNEVYGGPTDLPWALRIYRWDQEAGRAVVGADGQPVVLGTFHPAFLYELLWTFGVAAVVIWRTAASGSVTAGRSGCTWCSTRSEGCGSRCCGSTRRTRFWGCG
jgi:prolipoprotein diacylglyceryltransferase